MRLLLLRHGQTSSNLAGALDTERPGASLTALGHAQARALPEAFRAERISAIHASPLIRSQLTAAPLAGARGLVVGVEEGIEEISASDLEMRSDSASVAEYIEVAAGWIHSDLDGKLPGGHDGHTFLAGYDAAVARIAARHDERDTAVVVSHGAAIRVWVAIRARGVGSVEDRWLANTGMVALDGDPAAGWDLVHWYSDPLGGINLASGAAHDVTGAPVQDAVADDRATG